MQLSGAPCCSTQAAYHNWTLVCFIAPKHKLKFKRTWLNYLNSFMPTAWLCWSFNSLSGVVELRISSENTNNNVKQPLDVWFSERVHIYTHTLQCSGIKLQIYQQDQHQMSHSSTIVDSFFLFLEEQLLSWLVKWYFIVVLTHRIVFLVFWKAVCVLGRENLSRKVCRAFFQTKWSMQCKLSSNTPFQGDSRSCLQMRLTLQLCD